MTRTIETHKHNICNEHITVEAQDGPGPGGASHKYILKGPDKDFGGGVGVAAQFGVNLRFQNGPIAEVGVNGITNESLLAVVLDRLEGFQSGEYRCRENALAITKIEEAMHWLLHRTRQRESRGVEGTHKV